MAGWALGFLLLYMTLAFGLRTAVQWRRTDSSGFKGISGPPGSAEWLGGLLFAVAILTGFAAPVLDLLGVLDPISVLDGDVGHAAGAGIFAGGLLTTLYAQFAMGDSWRVGVDAAERTELVTGGPFGVMRHCSRLGLVDHPSTIAGGAKSWGSPLTTLRACGRSRSEALWAVRT